MNPTEAIQKLTAATEELQKIGEELTTARHNLTIAEADYIDHEHQISMEEMGKNHSAMYTARLIKQGTYDQRRRLLGYKAEVRLLSGKMEVLNQVINNLRLTVRLMESEMQSLNQPRI